MKQFEISVNGDVFGIYATTSERAALDLFARENGYEDEADLMNRWEHASDICCDLIQQMEQNHD